MNLNPIHVSRDHPINEHFDHDLSLIPTATGINPPITILIKVTIRISTQFDQPETVPRSSLGDPISES